MNKEGDILYITIGEPEVALTKELDTEILFRISQKTGEMVGITILYFMTRFSNIQKPQRILISSHFEIAPEALAAIE